ncbi:methyltransferase-like protein 17, mitochondrial isoform X1 [Selaginella moellendorffii]|uniref:methyltransferase-like protein 17, mitochondrial isoform X1 n=2 Tax=Selaginella moellendorffii TaxID=88036 RepID=UPI000D1C21A5|nr:methyltransferase-like protein 17, mitochondrial isoform X1 [Selaginella moellendorffii]|eukprot:XP_024530442.1 methyltransferase-like protein 17, mitochondrial isoform X1 [Selaginella moellendorffii]
MASTSKADLILKKRALAAAAFQRVPPVRIPDLLQSQVERLLREHPEVDIDKSITRMEAVKSFWADEELACSRQLRTLNPGAQKEKVKSWILATEQGPVKYLMDDAVAFAARSMPSTYAALYRVLSEVKRRIPDFRPRQVLDFGSGPGTSLWAIRELWPEQMKTAFLIETSAAMTSVCKSLAEGVETMPLLKYRTVLPNAGRSPRRDEKTNDLVICSFAMNEVPSMAHRMAVVNYLWTLTHNMLVIIEPGTLHGSALVRRLRDRVMTTENHRVRGQYRGLYLPASDPKAHSDLGAHVVAPCAHDGTCPMSRNVNGGICGLIQAIQAQEAKKLDKVSFSFVVMRRGFRKWGAWPLDRYKEGAPVVEPSQEDKVANLQGGWMRIVRPPTKLGNGITVPVCVPTGRNATDASLEDIKVTKDNIAMYSLASEAEMGDLWPR